MHKRKLTAFLLALVCFSALSIPCFAKNVTDSISVSAEAAALYVPSTKSFIYTKNENKTLPMASTTKIMTAIVALENARLEDTVVIDERAYGIEGSSAYMALGSRYSMEEMLYALMLRSANDAALAIAYTVAGEVDAFVDMMNEKCLELGLTKTHFDNPNGLDSDTHYTTAEELALIAAYAMENDTFRAIVGTHKICVGEGSDMRLFVNHNKLLKMYDGCCGIKTGFTKRCGRCLVSACERDGLELIAVTLDAPNDWSDHKALFDYGYKKLKCLTLADVGDYSFDIPLLDSEGQTLRVENTEALRITVPYDFGEAEENIRLTKFAVAPIKAGDILGSVIFTKDGEVLGSLKLVAMENAEPIKTRKNIFEYIKDKFG